MHRASVRARWHFERSFGAFSRVVALPPGIDQATASASYENGVLEAVLELPKEPEPFEIGIS